MYRIVFFVIFLYSCKSPIVLQNIECEELLVCYSGEYKYNDVGGTVNLRQVVKMNPAKRTFVIESTGFASRNNSKVSEYNIEGTYELKGDTIHMRPNNGSPITWVFLKKKTIFTRKYYTKSFIQCFFL